MSRVWKAHLLLVLITFIWGTTFVVIKRALTDISPLLFNALRMTLASACLAAFYWRELRGMKPPTIKAGTILGVLLWLGYEFQTTGLRLTSPSKSAFITGMSVVLVPVFLVLFWKRKVNRWTTLGVISAFVGLTLMTVPSGGAEWVDWAAVNRGDLLTLGCALAFGFHIIFLGQSSREFRFKQIAVLQTASAAVLMLATVPLMETVRVAWTEQLVIALVVTAVLCTAVAFTVQAWAQQFTPPTHTALIFSLEPVFAWVTSFVILGERLGLRVGAGAALILAGIMLSELRGSAAEPAAPGEMPVAG